jgi:hypothetical protein
MFAEVLTITAVTGRPLKNPADKGAFEARAIPK